MKKILVLFFVAATSLFSSGCIKTKAVMRERVDIEMSAGNRGTVMGNPGPAPKINKTRTIVETNIYIPFVEKPKTVDKEIKGNRGYLYKTGK